MKTHFVRATLLGSLVLGVVGCGGGSTESSGAASSGGAPKPAGNPTTPPPAPAPTFAVSPASVDLAPSATQTFTVSPTITVKWSIDESSGCGNISTSGLYTAPGAPATCHITATAQSDASLKAHAIARTVAPSTGFVTPSPISGDVVISMDSSAGTTPISPYIFGSLGGQSFQNISTLWRSGGNRMTGYNWENGYSNAGLDFGPYHNDTFMIGDGTPGSTYRSLAQGVYGRAGTWKNAALITIPTIGYVSGAWTGNVTLMNAPDVTTSVAPLLTGAQAWKTSLPGRPGDTTHAQATASFDPNDAFVYQDDALQWFKTNWPGHESDANAPVFVALDNEPDLWGSTHAEIRGKPPTQHVQTGYDELVNNNVAYAGAVKDVLGQNALVYAPVLSGWQGFTVNGNNDANGNAIAPPAGYAWFVEFYLKKMNDASTSAGRRLLDVLDLHWYPEASGNGGRIVGNDGATQDASMIVAREQAPRSLWDPSYLESSWIVNFGVNIPGCTWAGDASKCSIKLLPTLKQFITARYPGTKIAFTEWSYGREMDISNTIASSDVLGIFAREGVHSAATWPMSNGSDGCLNAAFSAYLNYDGAMSRFGDTYIPTTVTDPNRPIDTFLSGKARGDGTTIPTQWLERVTAYGSFDNVMPARAVVIAINKDMNATLNAGVTIKHNATFTKAEVYRVTGTNGGSGGCTGPARQADIAITATNAFNAPLPAQSVTVLVLRP